MAEKDIRKNTRDVGFSGYLSRRTDYSPKPRHKFLPEDIDEHWRDLFRFSRNRRFGDDPIVLAIASIILLINLFNNITSNTVKVLYVIFVFIPIMAGILYAFKLGFSKTFYMNTELGRCKCKVNGNRNNYAKLMIYYEKTVNQNFEKKNFFKKITDIFKPKYSKLLILKGRYSEMTDLCSEIIRNPYKTYNINRLIRVNDFNIENVDLLDTKNRININTSNVAELGKIPFIDKNDAVKIVMHIQKNGEFSSIWEFAEFMNYPQTELNSILKYVYVAKTLQEGEKFPLEENNLRGDDLETDPQLDI